MRPSSPRKGLTLTPTTEQEAIMAAPVARGECVLIHAYAGTGKTTTLQLLANAHPSKRILYVCFNRETAEQARKRFPRNAD